MIKAILFDFDGTLLNTNDLIFQSYRHGFLKALGRDITLQERVSLYGRPLYESLSVYGSKQDEIYRHYRTFQEKNTRRLVKEFPGAREGVLQFHRHGFLTAVVTSKRYETLMEGVDILRLRDVFDEYITPADTTAHKPSPEPALAACQRLDVRPREALMVGDSVFDLLCGKNAGTKTAGVSYSTTLRAIQKLNPDFMADSLLDLYEMVCQYNKGDTHV